MKKTKKSGTWSLTLSLILMVGGMSVGFLLLGIIYTGSVWVKALVFILYLFVVFHLVKYMRVFISQMKEIEGAKKDKDTEKEL